MTGVTTTQHQMIMERWIWHVVLDGDNERGKDDGGSAVRAAGLARVERLNEALADLDSDDVLDALSTDCPARDTAFRQGARELSGTLLMLANTLGISS